MALTKITSLETLREYLVSAMQLEHATIPPYLTALYSIHSQTNSAATHILRVIAVEEMLHLSLAANILNAVGGKPDLTAPGFVPQYPAYLPDGENDFRVDLQGFTKDALKTFLQIERPDLKPPPPSEDTRVVRRKPKADPPPAETVAGGLERAVARHSTATTLCAVPGDPTMRFYSIGDFYEEIVRGLKSLHDKYGSKMFSGDPRRQVSSEYFYSAGGELFPVTDLESAIAAAELIIEQGEGFDKGTYNSKLELSHYYRFDQLQKGRYYLPKNESGKPDEPNKPTGPSLTVDWDAVYPIKKNARLSDYVSPNPNDPNASNFPELYDAAKNFNKCYADILALLTAAFNGEPALLLTAVPKMFDIRNRITQLMHVPIPGMEGVNAAPTYEV